MGEVQGAPFSIAETLRSYVLPDSLDQKSLQASTFSFDFMVST